MKSPERVRLSVESATPGRSSRQRGFSLIEVLVTMLILAFGLLGVAGLLVGGISNAAGSESLNKANQLASDMADRIRANPIIALGATSEYLVNENAAWENRPDLWVDAVPAVTSIATGDVKAWMDAIAAQLPSGRGRIYNTVGGGARQINIQVAWSSCFGTLSDAEATKCRDDSANAFRKINFELRL
ncbi:MAG TPA: type IV pilus modification protein PilV [Burkholderiaceae bacterium]|nr:type IV pilus modification protein PilV [Burkholderiaceae bacterium]